MTDTGGKKVTVIKKEMGLTHREFYTELPNLLEGTPCRQSDDTIHFQDNGRTVEIVLGKQGFRELSHSMRMPVTPVTLRLHDFPDNEVEPFIRRFNLRFMKGGG
jgi:hypothetical protein